MQIDRQATWGLSYWTGLWELQTGRCTTNSCCVCFTTLTQHDFDVYQTWFRHHHSLNRNKRAPNNSRVRLDTNSFSFYYQFYIDFDVPTPHDDEDNEDDDISYILYKSSHHIIYFNLKKQLKNLLWGIISWGFFWWSIIWDEELMIHGYDDHNDDDDDYHILIYRKIWWAKNHILSSLISFFLSLFDTIISFII